MLGFAFSWVCDDLWFLAELFVALENNKISADCAIPNAAFAPH
jgi:hypothetical protein